MSQSARLNIENTLTEYPKITHGTNDQWQADQGTRDRRVARSTGCIRIVGGLRGYITTLGRSTGRVCYHPAISKVPEMTHQAQLACLIDRVC